MTVIGRLTTDGAAGRRFIGTGSPRFGWLPTADVVMSRVLVARREADLVSRTRLLFDSGWICPESNQVDYAGTPLGSREEFVWRVVGATADGALASSDIEHCETALLDASDWQATWIGWPASRGTGAQYFRHAYHVDGHPRRARLYVAAVGCVQAWSNGVRIGDALLDPATTDTSRSVLYQAFDITDLAHPGANVLGLVGTGGWAGRLAIAAQLELETDTGAQLVRTGNHGEWALWEAATGPVVEASMYDGETYDARLESGSWSLPEADPWGPMQVLGHACAVDPPAGKVRLQELEPIKVVGTRAPVSLTQLGSHRWVADFGQNTAGWCRIRVQLPRNARVEMRYAETTNPDGTVNQQNLRSARASDTFISNGAAAEWEPQWTCHGFRYVQIDGLGNQPTIEMRVVRSAVSSVSTFHSDDADLDAIETAVRWTESSNLHGIPTDCPQRDERMGWLNDVTVRAETSLYTFSSSRLLAKFVDDIADTQAAAGAIADTAPFRLGARPADPVALCYALVPLLLYRHYGDDRPARSHLDGIRAWCDYLDSRSRDGLIGYSHYGDWAAPDDDTDTGNGFPLSASTPGVFVSSAHYVATRRTLAELARIVGRDEIADESERAAASVSAAIQRAFADGTGYCGGSQGANATALFLGLVPAEHQDVTVAALVDDVTRRNRLTTGNLATKYLLEALSQAGRGDLAMGLVQRRGYPSWRYMLDHGATTIWERWENATGDGMNSHNHPMYATVGAWLYRRVAGLRLHDESVAFSRIVIDPLTTTSVRRASLSLNTVRGPARVSWRRDGDQVALETFVPSGATAFVVPIATHLGPGRHQVTFPSGTDLASRTGSAATNKRRANP